MEAGSSHCLWRIFNRMNFTQMHERLRLELLRRIQRGTLSVSLLARQTGFGQSHLSNFLHGRRQLSLEAMDRILAAQQMSAADLMPAQARRLDLRLDLPSSEEHGTVPVVSHATAMFEPQVRPSAVHVAAPSSRGPAEVGAFAGRAQPPRLAALRGRRCPPPRRRFRWSRWCCPALLCCSTGTNIRWPATARAGRISTRCATRRGSSCAMPTTSSTGWCCGRTASSFLWSCWKWRPTRRQMI